MKKSHLVPILVTAMALPAFAGVVNSGLNVGESVSAFHPTHVAGPLKGTDGCPPCTYGMRPQVQVWSNGDAAQNVAGIGKALAGMVGASKHDLKAFVISLDGKEAASKIASLSGADKTLHVAYIAKDNEALDMYKINTASEVKNTVFVYKNKKVVAKMVNLKADAAGLKTLKAAVAQIDN